MVELNTSSPLSYNKKPLNYVLFKFEKINAN
jgi:hypothetical protein